MRRNNQDGATEAKDPLIASRLANAEPYSAAVVLFEMATGGVPRFGDGLSDPASVRDEATITPDMFDPAVAEPLAGFFRTGDGPDAAAGLGRVGSRAAVAVAGHRGPGAGRLDGRTTGAASGRAGGTAAVGGPVACRDRPGLRSEPGRILPGTAHRAVCPGREDAGGTSRVAARTADPRPPGWKAPARVGCPVGIPARPWLGAAFARHGRGRRGPWRWPGRAGPGLPGATRRCSVRRAAASRRR
jgi:hypothetical protein